MQCVAMNRTLTNVLFGGISAPANQPEHKIEGVITKTSVDDTVDALLNAESVILVRYLSSEHRTAVDTDRHAIAGRWIWHGCGQSAVRYRRRRGDAEVEGHRDALRHPPCGWEVCFTFFAGATNRSSLRATECPGSATCCSPRPPSRTTVSNTQIYTSGIRAPPLTPSVCSRARDGRDQRRLREHGRDARHRRERHREPDRARGRLAHRGHARAARVEEQAGHRHEARHVQRIRCVFLPVPPTLSGG